MKQIMAARQRKREINERIANGTIGELMKPLKSRNKIDKLETEGFKIVKDHSYKSKTSLKETNVPILTNKTKKTSILQNSNDININIKKKRIYGSINNQTENDSIDEPLPKKRRKNDWNSRFNNLNNNKTNKARIDTFGAAIPPPASLLKANNVKIIRHNEKGKLTNNNMESNETQTVLRKSRFKDNIESNVSNLSSKTNQNEIEIKNSNIDKSEIDILEQSKRDANELLESLMNDNNNNNNINNAQKLEKNEMKVNNNTNSNNIESNVNYSNYSKCLKKLNSPTNFKLLQKNTQQNHTRYIFIHSNFNFVIKI